MRRTSALIVGGGPAGAAAAIALARAGGEVRLIERSEGPRDMVCGGFLGWDALAALGRLGIDPAALGARPIDRLRLVAGRRRIEVRLPRPAAGLSRRTLDEALLVEAGKAGANVLRGRAARAADPERLAVRLDDGEEMQASALLLATGKYELRGAARPRDTSGDPVGLRTALALPQGATSELDGVIELHLFDEGYAGLLVQEDGLINFCLSASRERLKQAGGVEQLIARLVSEAPALGARIAAVETASWSAVTGVPYGWRARDTSPGLFRIGDQGAVIASLAGDGVAIALESSLAAAAELIGGEGEADAYQSRFAARARRPLAVAEMLRGAAEHHFARRAMMGLLGLAPGLASLGARLTRIGG